MGTFESMKLLLLTLLVSPAVSLIAKPSKEAENDSVDRFMQFKIKPGAAYVASGLIVGVATGVQVATPGWVEKALGPSCKSGFGALTLRCIDALNDMKSSNPLGLTLGHGIITKACADLLAQTIPQQAAMSAWIDPLRLFRSMLASVLSTSLPFYFWTRFMARSMPIAPSWVTGMLGRGAPVMSPIFSSSSTQLDLDPLNRTMITFPWQVLVLQHLRRS